MVVSAGFASPLFGSDFPTPTLGSSRGSSHLECLRLLHLPTVLGVQRSEDVFGSISIIFDSPDSVLFLPHFIGLKAFAQGLKMYPSVLKSWCSQLGRVALYIFQNPNLQVIDLSADDLFVQEVRRSAPSSPLLVVVLMALLAIFFSLLLYSGWFVGMFESSRTEISCWEILPFSSPNTSRPAELFIPATLSRTSSDSLIDFSPKVSFCPDPRASSAHRRIRQLHRVVCPPNPSRNSNPLGGLLLPRLRRKHEMTTICSTLLSDSFARFRCRKRSSSFERVVSST